MNHPVTLQEELNEYLNLLDQSLSTLSTCPQTDKTRVLASNITELKAQLGRPNIVTTIRTDELCSISTRVQNLVTEVAFVKTAHGATMSHGG